MIYDYCESFIEGVYEFKMNVFKDERGSIRKIFHKSSFDELKLDCNLGETLITENYHKGVVRGFHFQKPPYAQAKTIYCVSGAIYDVVLDLRKNSSTYGKYDVFEITHEKENFLYLPKGVANCYMILADQTIIAYNLTSQYMKEYEDGIRWDSINVKFPNEKKIISEKDMALQRWESFVSPF